MAGDQRLAWIGPRSERPAEEAGAAPAGRWIGRAFTRFEQFIYLGLGVLLGGSALVLLGHAVWVFGRGLAAGTLPGGIVVLLDQILLILMIVEILYTVQVSFEQHALMPEPFLVVGLIAGIRRILVLTAEFSKLLEAGDAVFRNAMLELGLLTVLVVALVVSLGVLRRRGGPRVEREPVR